MPTFTIRGVVREDESGTGLAGLVVRAYDKDRRSDDLLGSAVLDRCQPNSERHLFPGRDLLEAYVTSGWWKVKNSQDEGATSDRLCSA